MRLQADIYVTDSLSRRARPHAALYLARLQLAQKITLTPPVGSAVVGMRVTLRHAWRSHHVSAHACSAFPQDNQLLPSDRPHARVEFSGRVCAHRTQKSVVHPLVLVGAARCRGFTVFLPFTRTCAHPEIEGKNFKTVGMEAGRLVVLSQNGAEGECYPLGEKVFTIGRCVGSSGLRVCPARHRLVG
jgi:hypothetical protein